MQGLESGCGGLWRTTRQKRAQELSGVIKEKIKMASANEWSVALRAEKEKISVFKSDTVDVKERAVLNQVSHIGLDYL